jgi:hypothetical protein
MAQHRHPRIEAHELNAADFLQMAQIGLTNNEQGRSAGKLTSNLSVPKKRRKG